MPNPAQYAPKASGFRLQTAIIAAIISVVFALAASAAEDRPNILLIVADDLGFSDIGAYGGDIPTPNIDALADQGLKFTNFHALPTCAPSRSVLYTGTENHIAGLGSQAVTDRQKGHEEYQGHLTDDVRTIPEILKPLGYRTYFSGKWHLGDEEGQYPSDRGFEESFTLLHGGASHYSDMLPLGSLEPAEYRRNGEAVDELPEDFYSTQYFADQLLEWLERDKAADEPFFASLAFTAPHDPLHAPAEYTAKYKGKFANGYEELQKERFERLKTLGLIPESQRLPTWPNVIPRWDDLSEEEQATSQRDMEIYAAMVDYMDEQIGRTIQWLKDNDEFDNTLIVFISDNGADGISETIYPGHDAEFRKQFDNSLENRGLPGSFVSLDSGWATASTAAFKLFKGFMTEGGLRVPAVIKMPQGFETDRETGDHLNAFVHIRDVLPTILELAEAEHPSESDNSIEHMRGKSLLSLMSGDTDQIYSDTEGVGYELHGTRAFIQGPWKILQSPLPMGDGRWELFNIVEDPAEEHDLSRQYPEIRAELIENHRQYEQEHGIVFDYINVMAPANVLHKAILAILGGLGVATMLGLVVKKPGIAYRGTSSPNHILIAVLGLSTVAGAYLLTGDGYHIGLYLLGAVSLIWLAVILVHKARWWLFLVWFVGLASVLVVWLMTSGHALRAIVG